MAEEPEAILERLSHTADALRGVCDLLATMGPDTDLGLVDKSNLYFLLDLIWRQQDQINSVLFSGKFTLEKAA